MYRSIDYLSWVLCDNLCAERRLPVACGRTVWYTVRQQLYDRNPLNAELNTICHMLALLGAHHILHISRIRVKLHHGVS